MSTVPATPATRRLYLEDGQGLVATATVVAVRESALACERTCFYPGGGGLPADHGTVTLMTGETWPVHRIEVDGAGVLWHLLPVAPAADLLGQTVTLAVDGERRRALGRYHTVLHVVNAIVLTEHGGWITGAQIAPDYARIDFKLDGLSPVLRAELEAQVNRVLGERRAVTAFWLAETEFHRRPDLLRTLEVRPPVSNGRVRVVAIEGFDEQACGGTHAPHTSAVGRFAITRAENKGRINKRLYVRLDEPVGVRTS